MNSGLPASLVGSKYSAERQMSTSNELSNAVKFIAMAGFAWCALSGVTRSAEPRRTAQAMIFSLADDLSYSDNRANSTWSYRLDDFANSPPAFPLLTSTDRDANALWGSSFLVSPRMWSDAAGYWGHAITDDWVHWRDLPYAIYPGIEKVSASGGTVVEKDRVLAYYPGHGAGQMVAIASDPLLLNWKKLPEAPVSGGPLFGDSCIWKEGDTYFGLRRAQILGSSRNLIDWKVLNGNFLGGSSFPIDDGNCPTFRPIGDKHILFLFSHTRNRGGCK